MSKQPSRSLFLSIAHTLAALFSSATAFHREWKRFEAGSRSDGIEGRWQGEWLSAFNGHRGELKAVVTNLQNGSYQCIFHATYSKILRVCYEVNLKGTEQDRRVNLQGDADLGRLAGGIYHYSGEASRDDFNCTYKCKYDHGRFRMKPAN